MKIILYWVVFITIVSVKLPAQSIDLRKLSLKIKLSVNECCNYIDGEKLSMSSNCLVHLTKDSLFVTIVNKKTNIAIKKFVYPTGDSLKFLGMYDNGMQEEWEISINEKSKSFLVINRLRKDYFIIDFSLLLNMGQAKRTVIDGMGRWNWTAQKNQ